jgi:hypothetical protein
MVQHAVAVVLPGMGWMIASFLVFTAPAFAGLVIIMARLSSEAPGEPGLHRRDGLSGK